MATTKNITMKQFNGTDYDTLYPKTDVKQIENLTPSSIGAVAKSGDTMTGALEISSAYYNSQLKIKRAAAGDSVIGFYGPSAQRGALGFSVNDELICRFQDKSSNADTKFILHTGNAQTLGFSKIATGSYVGTGTAGQGQLTATVLTFNFAPKFLILVQDEGALPDGTTLLSKVGAYSIYGYNGFYHFYTYSSGFACKLLGWGTNTLSYYTNGADATYQFNASGKTYYYMALG